MGTAKSVALLIVVSNLEETAISPGVTVSWTSAKLFITIFILLKAWAAHKI